MAGFGALKFLFDNTLSTDYDMFIVDINDLLMTSVGFSASEISSRSGYHSLSDLLLCHSEFLLK